MSKLISNLPTTEIEKLLNSLVKHKAIFDEIQFAKKYGNREVLEIDAITKFDGYILVNFFLDDLHMLRLHDGAWVQAYLGLDDSYNKEVLEEKYSYRYVGVANIEEIGKTKIYI